MTIQYAMIFKTLSYRFCQWNPNKWIILLIFMTEQKLLSVIISFSQYIMHQRWNLVFAWVKYKFRMRVADPDQKGYVQNRCGFSLKHCLRWEMMLKVDISSHCLTETNDMWKIWGKLPNNVQRSWNSTECSKKGN